MKGEMFLFLISFLHKRLLLMDFTMFHSLIFQSLNDDTLNV